MADGSVKIDIMADDSDIKKKLNGVDDLAEEAAGGLDKLEKSAEDVGKGFDVADVAIGNFVGDALTGLKDNIIETVGNIAALAEETREYREDMAKLDSAFTSSGHSTETAQKAYDGFYKILGESDRTVEAVNHLAEMTENEEELAQWSTICAGVTARFGDSLPIEGLTEAANETAKVGAVTGPLADALNWAGISEDEFNEKLAACNSEQERASLITSTLNGEYAAAAEEYNKLTANTQAARDATNNMEQAQAALGAAIEPVTTAWTNMKANALQWFVDEGLPKLQTGWQWIQDNLPTVAVVVGGLTAAWLAFGGAQTIATTATTIFTAAQAALKLVMDASPIGKIILLITALVAGFMLLWNNCEGFRNFWIGLWEGVKQALAPIVEWIKEAFGKAWEYIKSAWDKVQPYFSAIWEKIKAVFSVVGEVLGAYFTLAWELIKAAWSMAGSYFANIWNTIKTVFSVVATYLGGMFQTAWAAIQLVWNVVAGYFQAVWNTIKGIFSVVKNVLSGNWSEAWEAIKGIVSGWTSYFSNIWQSIKNVFSAVQSWFSNTFSAAWNGIKSVFSGWGAFFSELWTKVKNAFKISNIVQIGKDILTGLWNGINDKVEWLKGKVKGVVDKIKGWFTGKDGFDEHSPSKWAEQVAVYVNEGLAGGFIKSANKPLKATETVMNKMQELLEDRAQQQMKTIVACNDECKQEIANHNAERLKLDEDVTAKLLEIDEKYAEDKAAKNAELVKLDEKLAEDKKKKDADLVKLNKEYKEKKEKINADLVKIEKEYGEDILKTNTDYDLAVEKEKERHVQALEKIEAEKHEIISSKMQELVDLGEKYKDETKTLWEELDKSISDLQANYDNQLASRTKSIADSLNLWSEATKNAPSIHTLTNNLKSQVSVLESYNEAIATLESRNVSAAFIQQLKELGVGSTGEIQTIARMTDKQLESYVALWEEKNRLAHDAALEELEPLKAETEVKIQELTDAAMLKYTEMRAKFKAEGALLAEELKQDMIAAGLEGYEAIQGQIDTYVESGVNLMDGVVQGVVTQSPALSQAVTNAVNRAIAAAKEAAGIASPSKVMKKEVGANLAEGVNVGWADKIANIKDKMAVDMQGITARIKAVVSAENARMAQGVGVRDTGFTEVAQAVGMQTAGINSLASEYRRGSSARVTVPLIIDRRELGHAIIDLGSIESERLGTNGTNVVFG